ncbi:hypothetical protein Tco_0205141 [Tanacetum coccineum]
MVLICRDGEKGERHSSLCVLAMKAWLGLGRYGGTEKGMKVAKKTAQKSKTLSTDIEGWEKADVLLDKAGNNGLKLKTKVESLLYNHTLTRTMVEYASAVYTADSTELFTWTCSRCDGLTKIVNSGSTSNKYVLNDSSPIVTRQVFRPKGLL